MRLKISLFILLLIHTCFAWAQLRPKDHAALHYRLVGFSSGEQRAGVTYQLQIGLDTMGSAAQVDSSLIYEDYNKENKFTYLVPSFGKTYFWRVNFKSNDAIIKYGAWHLFSTLPSPYVDTQYFKMSVLKDTILYKNAYIFHDGTSTIFNSKGEAIWFLPDLSKTNTGNKSIRDFKPTSDHTFTFLMGDVPYEIDYDGYILWTAPTIDGRFHHEFTKLANHHYMLLGSEQKKCIFPVAKDSLPIIAPNEANNPELNLKQTAFGILYEYDNQGNLVWKWHMAPFYQQANLAKTISVQPVRALDIHENSFYFNEQKQVVYLSCKNIHHIFKIKYPSGKVIGQFNGNATDQFNSQHGLKMNSKGNVVLYNNNMFKGSAVPKIIELKETSANAMYTQWESLTYPYDPPASNTNRNLGRTGGNIELLNDSTFFVANCTPYNNLYITNKKNEILWLGEVYTRENADKPWQPQTTYRASLLHQAKGIDPFIWQSKH